MNRIRTLLVTAMLSGLITVTVVAGDITCDFENGIPADWKMSSSRGDRPRVTPNAELEKNGGNTVLELGKEALMTLGDEELLNFSIEATVRREFDTSQSHVGFQFRNGYRVYLRKQGR